MSKDFRRKNAARRRGGVSKQLLFMFVSFLFGYLSASIFDFTSLSSWLSTQVLLQHTIPSDTRENQQAQLPKPKFEFYTLLANERSDTRAQMPVPAQISAPTPMPVPAPMPEIAKIPASSESIGSSHSLQTSPVENADVIKNKPVMVLDTRSAPTKPKLLSTQPLNKDAFLVQVASFKSDHEAERMKALLSMKGFRVTVAIVTQQHIQWYRVNLGPFASRTQAEQAKLSIARSQHIVGMVRKIDV